MGPRVTKANASNFNEIKKKILYNFNILVVAYVLPQYHNIRCAEADGGKSITETLQVIGRHLNAFRIALKIFRQL